MDDSIIIIIIIIVIFINIFKPETARIIWSFGPSDPTTLEIPLSFIHTHRGAQYLNLLGGLSSAAPDPDDLTYYDVTVDNVNATHTKGHTSYIATCIKH